MNHELVITLNDFRKLFIRNGNSITTHFGIFCIEHKFFYKPPEKFSEKNLDAKNKTKNASSFYMKRI